jgi:hypothetical protein
MKKLLLAIILIVTVLPACTKYKDGPKISLRTRTARLMGNWTLESATFNGTDITSFFKSSEKFAILKKRWGYMGDYGTWDMGEDGDDVTFNSDIAGNQPKTYRLLRLKNTELWMKYTATNGDVTEMHFKQ